MLPTTRFSSLHLLYDKQRGIQAHLQQVPGVNRDRGDEFAHLAAARQAPDSGKVFFMDTEVQVPNQIARRVQELEATKRPEAFELACLTYEALPSLDNAAVQPYVETYRQKKTEWVGYDGIGRAKPLLDLLTSVVIRGYEKPSTEPQAASSTDEYHRSLTYQPCKQHYPNAPDATFTQDDSTTTLSMPLPAAQGWGQWFNSLMRRPS